MSTNLLFVPYRKTERIEFGAAIRDIISKEYYQTPSAFEGDIREVDTLRGDIIDLGSTPHDLALLKRYYVHLCALEGKFPNDLVEFPWYGTLGYRVTGPVKLKSFFFERLNVLYNIASLYTHMALEQDRKNDEGLKKACLYFQYAASHFALIVKLSEKETSVTLPLDMQKDTIETLKFLSLAQAQEVFWQKATADKVKDSLVARLAMQVSDFYNETLQSANRGEGFRTEWISHITVKKAHFEAVANFRASLASVASSKYGEEVSHLQRAQNVINGVSPNLKFVSQAVEQDFEGLTKIISETLRTAEKDNDLIYLQDVPQTPPRIISANVTKDLPLDEIVKPAEALKTGSYGKQLFRDLLPFDIIQISQAYRERQSEYVQRHLAVPIKSLTKMLHEFLFMRNLPSAVETVDKPLALPVSLLDHQQEVKTKGGVVKLKRALRDIENLSMDGERLLAGANDRLKLEAEEDELLRQRQGSKHWTREPSATAAAPFYQRIKDLENYLAQAKNGDKTIREQFNSIESLLVVLASSEAEIRNYIPNSKARQLDPSLRRVVAELKECLSKARKLEFERDNFLEVVEVKSEQYNILPKIVSEYKAMQQDLKDVKLDMTSFEPVFGKHIKNFQSDLDFLESQKKTQIELEHKIDDLDKKFNHMNSLQGSNDDRAKVLKNLDFAYNSFVDLLNNVSQGLKFYNDFNARCQGLIQEIDQFVSKRRVEARDMEAELNNRFQDMKLNSSPQKETPKDNITIQRPQSPALIAPKAKPAKSKSGLWNPDSGIKFN
ncbi:Rim20p [Cyberlindnera jadinii NRRL Y-1542]|uniref:BRO1-domain-containing protein n=1 Tax=Cyberlindnera jadinii (strain ATCC 18201 / CBS 1600 / BCRC 20928 / JCM 3617 / NBRC 0987 / NRRL Y-1542) TaxID=983966 RepID=A0A1E4S8V7_CYBJN|nr:BRO1-domain-containing protein [Cyberlindnera jadinii NRRL Y-1542]ODV75903.1 BRO1-domain-containing protein [Cyberlindnera jadinii NRRL Y-1542]